MNRILRLYQYLAPLILFPLGYWLWFRSSGSHGFAAYAMTIPVLTAYIVPGIGTNVVRLWEFNTRLRLGRFRPHHGFVFGSATAVLAFGCSGIVLQGTGFGAVLTSGFVMASVLGFWNWLYDIYAIRADIIRVHNKPSFNGEGAEAIATDYAPAYFGMFGFIYGIALIIGHRNPDHLLLIWVQYQVISATVPVVFFMGLSRLRHGYWGVNPYQPVEGESE